MISVFSGPCESTRERADAGDQEPRRFAMVAASKFLASRRLRPNQAKGRSMTQRLGSVMNVPICSDWVTISIVHFPNMAIALRSLGLIARQPGNAFRHEPRLPSPHYWFRFARAVHDLGRSAAVGCGQNDADTPHGSCGSGRQNSQRTAHPAQRDGANTAAGAASVLDRRTSQPPISPRNRVQAIPGHSKRESARIALEIVDSHREIFM